MKQIPVPLLTLVAGILVTLVSFWVGQNHGLLPEQASEQAPLVDGFFNVMVTIATALFIVVEGAILIFIIQFRQRRGDNSDGVPVEGSVPLEVFWTAIPAIIVIGIGIYSVAVYSEMGGFTPSGNPTLAHHHSPVNEPMMGSAIAAPLANPDGVEPESRATEEQIAYYGIGAPPQEGNQTAELTVNVTGLQYAWIFEYPDSEITTAELHVPVGRDVQLNLSSQDVIHSFWVPQFRLKQDAIPGQDTQLRFIATKPGVYPVVCAELCGAYHGGMRTQLVVETPEAFATWQQESRMAQ